MPVGGTSDDLRYLKSLAPHSVDKSVLSVVLHDGGVLRVAARAVVHTFGSQAQRERFQREVLTHLAAHNAAAA